jgi:hypothetical protein
MHFLETLLEEKKCETIPAHVLKEVPILEICTELTHLNDLYECFAWIRIL